MLWTSIWQTFTQCNQLLIPSRVPSISVTWQLLINVTQFSQQPKHLDRNNSQDSPPFQLSFLSQRSVHTRINYGTFSFLLEARTVHLFWTLSTHLHTVHSTVNLSWTLSTHLHTVHSTVNLSWTLSTHLHTVHSTVHLCWTLSTHLHTVHSTLHLCWTLGTHLHTVHSTVNLSWTLSTHLHTVHSTVSYCNFVECSLNTINHKTIYRDNSENFYDYTNWKKKQIQMLRSIKCQYMYSTSYVFSWL